LVDLSVLKNNSSSSGEEEPASSCKNTDDMDEKLKLLKKYISRNYGM
jgi:hypothetical protein